MSCSTWGFSRSSTLIMPLARASAAACMASPRFWTRRKPSAKFSAPAKVVRNHGNVDAEFTKGGKVLEATYYTPMLAHASMEPPAAVADFRNGKVTVWTATQNPQAAQDTVAAALGIEPRGVSPDLCISFLHRVFRH